MAWLWAALVAFGLLLVGGLFLALSTRLLEPLRASRGRNAQLVLRLRFLFGLVLLGAPIFTFFKLTPSFSGKMFGVMTGLVILVVAAAWILVESFSEIFIRHFLSTKLGIGIPVILMDVMKGILYLVSAILILHVFFNVDVKPFLTTSAIVTVIIGLAFQDTLGNVIAGLALHFASPYRVGDWIRVGSLEGKILRMEWRSTLILTRSNDAIVIPHVSMAKNEIYNYSVPSPVHAREIRVPVSYRFPPGQADQVLRRVAEEHPLVLRNPRPEIYLLSFEPDFMIYGLWVWIDDFEHLPEILSSLSHRVWYALYREGYAMEPRRYQVFMEPRASEIERDGVAEFLGAHPLFSTLERDALDNLCRRVKRGLYGPGEKIIQEGDRNQDFYLLRRGSAVVYKNARPFYQYKPGEFFGEMALLTGEPRKATIQAGDEAEVLIFGKELLAPCLEANADFLKTLSEAITERLKTLPPEDLTAVSAGETRPEGLRNYIVRRIREFFLRGSG